MPNYPGCGYQDDSDINDEYDNFVINGLCVERLQKKFIHTFAGDAFIELAPDWENSYWLSTRSVSRQNLITINDPSQYYSDVWRVSDGPP